MNGNLFDRISRLLPEERIEALITRDHVRIERIVSRGHASPDGFWYDQEQNEFVVLLQGSAGLRMEEPMREIVLKSGDYIDIPAHVRHRVDWTDPQTDTVWLAVFY